MQGMDFGHDFFFGVAIELDHQDELGDALKEHETIGD